MDTVTLSDLGPIIAAVLGPMLLFVVASMRYQHVDSTKSRELIERSTKENRDLIEQSAKENRDLIERNRELIEQTGKENRDLIERNRELIEQTAKENRDLIEQTAKESRDLIERNRELIEQTGKELGRSLGDARERLARVEGFLRVSPPPRQGNGGGDASAEAA